MYNVIFYEAANGECEVEEWILRLNEQANNGNKDNTFILLHYFVKKTQKTPKREIECAKRRLQEYMDRNGGK